MASPRGLFLALGLMKKFILFLAIVLLAACSRVTSTEARSIAYERLSAFSDGPSLRGKTLLAALQVTEQKDGRFLVEVRDEPRNLLWAVIVQPSGESKITRMAING